ncbi:MAG: hypothetical protein J4F28_01215 [Nitrosopumilaceae archaeon]|nr:hypothetical protein [Nitrosopumilaceae archaeon]
MAVTVAADTEITLSNADAAVHALTSGTSDDGADGVFDSRLVTIGSTCKFTIYEPGTYHRLSGAPVDARADHSVHMNGDGTTEDAEHA